MPGGMTPTNSYTPQPQPQQQQVFAPPPHQMQQVQQPMLHQQQVQQPITYQQPLLIMPGQKPQVQSHTPNYPQVTQMQQQQPQMQGQQPAVQQMAFGDWAAYQDELGTFFMHVPSGQQFERPPPECKEAYKLYRAEQDQLHQQQLQKLELQKQQIDQQLAQKTESLRMTYGIPTIAGY